jgi:hypothetical protein
VTCGCGRVTKKIRRAPSKFSAQSENNVILPKPNAGSNSSRAEENIYYLVSFAPASGVGYYEVQRTLYRFELLKNQHLEVVQRASYSDRADSQSDFGLYFVTLPELVAFGRHQYLKEKKETSYAVLFTRALKYRLFLKALTFLDQPELSLIPISSVLVSLLEAVADPQLVAEVLKRACELRLENVKSCLTKSFRHLICHHAVVTALRSSRYSASKGIIDEFESMLTKPDPQQELRSRQREKSL